MRPNPSNRALLRLLLWWLVLGLVAWSCDAEAIQSEIRALGGGSGLRARHRERGDRLVM